MLFRSENIPAPGVPESFKVLIKELQALCLDIKVLDAERNIIEIPELDPEDMATNDTRPMREEEPEDMAQSVEDVEAMLSGDDDDDMDADFGDMDFTIDGDDGMDDMSIDALGELELDDPLSDPLDDFE